MISSPYLQAIQDVAGSTAGEKYRTLNDIARRIIKESDVQDKTIRAQSSLELPDILVPLVNLEIAKIVRDPDRIVEALKSDDISIFNRALRTKWFFDGTIKTVTNVTYFQYHIFDWVSVKNRLQLIKTLSVHLAANRKKYIAEEFYSALSDMYGSAQPEPLLCACSESFIWQEITTRKLVLTARTVKKLFVKYPDVIAEYLELNKPSDEPNHRNIHKIPIKKYICFLVRLIRNYSDVFIDLIKSNTSLHFKLSRNSTKRFLRREVDALIESPCILGPFMDLKSLSSKLTNGQFKSFFRNLFLQTSETHSTFSFKEMYKYLEYYPSSEKVSLILSTFEEVYQENFLDQYDSLDSEVLCLLSPKYRVHVARRKIENDPQWPTDYWEWKNSWRCYLPIEESIPILKEQIRKTPDSQKRRGLLWQLVYSCKVNKDENALLKVLEYIVTRHRNESGTTLFRIAECLIDQFEIHNLSHDHWKILDEFINILRASHKLFAMCYVVSKLFRGKLHFNLIHGLSITEPIKFLYMCQKDDIFCRYNWNILTEYPIYERKCLMEFLDVAPTFHIKEKATMNLINSFVKSIYYFNQRISKTASEVEPMTIENEWLLAQIQLSVNADEAGDLRLNLKKCDARLYNAFVRNDKNDKMIDLKSTEEYNEWKKNPKRIEENWEKYLEECESEIHRKYAQRFIKLCRWHQNIPIKFTEKCLKDVSENRDSQALIVLSLLLEGPVFENFISEFLSTKWTVNIDAVDSKEKYLMIQLIAKALSVVNPSVSLNFTAQSREGDTIHMAAKWFKVLSRRTSVANLIPFATTLMNRSVSISKHFIRNFSTAANLNECHRVYMNLWRNEKRQSIRNLVFKKIFHLFVTNPNDKTWTLITECIDNLTVNDKDPLNSICCLDEIPHLYTAQYVQRVLKTLRKLSDVVDNMDPKFISSRIIELLRLPDDVTSIFSEELHEEILMTYFADLSLPTEVLAAAQYYLVNSYIDPALDERESRMNFYSEMFKNILKNQWDVPDPRRPNRFPANYMVDSQMNTVLWYFGDEDIQNHFVHVTAQSFLSVLDPSQAPSFYCFYVLASYCQSRNKSIEEYVNKIGDNISAFVGAFGEGFIPTLGELLDECVELYYYQYGTHYENIMSVIEKLLGLENELTTLLAIAVPLPKEVEMDDERYTNLLQTLHEQENRSAIALASTLANRRGF